MEKMKELWNWLQLNEDKDSAINIDDEEFEAIERKGDLCLVGEKYGQTRPLGNEL